MYVSKRKEGRKGKGGKWKEREGGRVGCTQVLIQVPGLVFAEPGLHKMAPSVSLLMQLAPKLCTPWVFHVFAMLHSLFSEDKFLIESSAGKWAERHREKEKGRDLPGKGFTPLPRGKYKNGNIPECSPDGRQRGPLVCPRACCRRSSSDRPL